MRLFLDACVLFPPVTREILLGYARAGGFTPLWSARVLEEWALAMRAKQGEAAEVLARGDIALLRAGFPGGEISNYEEIEDGIFPPDPADAHVIAAAVKGEAEAVITFNIKDFPLRLLRPFGLGRMHPDEFLSTALARDGQRMEAALRPLEAIAKERGVEFRAFLKRGTLPRLGKGWERSGF